MGAYIPEEDGPEARMAREEYEHERRVHQEIVKLYKSIPPDASSWKLFTFAERQRYGLRSWRK